MQPESSGYSAQLKSQFSKKPLNRLTDSVQSFIIPTRSRFSARNQRISAIYPTGWMDLSEIAGSFSTLLASQTCPQPSCTSLSPYDAMFYLLVGMLFYFAIVKFVFGKYLGNLLTLFFRVSMRQQQIREQVLQSAFPSLFTESGFCAFRVDFTVPFVSVLPCGEPNQFWLSFLCTPPCSSGRDLVSDQICIS